MSDHDSYFQYLKKRSRLGAFYRRFYLYPRLCRYLDGQVLDVGCGLGDFLDFRPDTIGLDVNPKTVEWCKTKGREAYLIEKGRFPFEDKLFDSAVLDNVIEHLLDPSQLLGEIQRVLDDDGVLVVGVPGRCGHRKDADHKVFYSKERLVKTIEGFGFQVDRVFAMPLPVSWLENVFPQYCIYGVFHNSSTP